MNQGARNSQKSKTATKTATRTTSKSVSLSGGRSTPKSSTKSSKRQSVGPAKNTSTDKVRDDDKLHTHDRLLQKAKSVFAAKGFEGATVKDLADAAGVNISLISYHFGGKEGLYRTCLESFGSERVEISERILKPAHSAEDLKLRLRLFAEEFMAIHLSEPESCKLINRSLDNLDTISTDVFKNIFIRVFEALHHFLESAQKNRLLRAELDVEITAFLMFGSLMHLMRSQELARILGRRTIDEQKYRDQVIDHWVETFTSGLIADRSSKK
jgi:TetR/AcrR family transcriptional regulator